MEVTQENCAAPTSASPPANVLRSFQGRLVAFTKQALPFSGVKVSSNLSVNQPKITEYLDQFCLAYRQKIWEFLGSHPIFKNKHMIVS